MVIDLGAGLPAFSGAGGFPGHHSGVHAAAVEGCPAQCPGGGIPGRLSGKPTAKCLFPAALEKGLDELPGLMLLKDTHMPYQG